MNRTESAQAAPVSLAGSLPAGLQVTIPQPSSGSEISRGVFGGET